MSEIALFVSHSAVDVELAKLIVQAVEKALPLSPTLIRCTSLDGYRLPGGSDTDETLRDEIFNSRAFIALLTPRSMDSTYVLFELGARWGAGKRLFPLIGCGTTATTVGGPLAGLHLLNASSPPQLLQLLQELGDTLELQLRPPALYREAVDAVAMAAAQVHPSGYGAGSTQVVHSNLSDDEVIALLQDWLGRRTLRENTSPIVYENVETELGIPKTRIAALLETAGEKYKYVTERKGDTLIVFKQVRGRSFIL